MDEGLIHILDRGDVPALAEYAFGPAAVHRYPKPPVIPVTILQMACIVARVDCVEWLLAHKGGIPVVEKSDILAYVNRSTRIYPLMVMTLLRAGAEPQNELMHVIRYGGMYDEEIIQSAIRMLIDYGGWVGPSSHHQSANLDLLMFATHYQLRVSHSLRRYVLLETMARKRLRLSVFGGATPEMLHLIARHIWNER